MTPLSAPADVVCPGTTVSIIVPAVDASASSASWTGSASAGQCCVSEDLTYDSTTAGRFARATALKSRPYQSVHLRAVADVPLRRARIFAGTDTGSAYTRTVDGTSRAPGFNIRFTASAVNSRTP